MASVPANPVSIAAVAWGGLEEDGQGRATGRYRLATAGGKTLLTWWETLTLFKLIKTSRCASTQELETAVTASGASNFANWNTYYLALPSAREAPTPNVSKQLADPTRCAISG